MQVVKATSEEQRRIAVVGSGMAGLVIAHLLHRDPRSRYRVTVFESVSGKICAAPFISGGLN